MPKGKVLTMGIILHFLYRRTCRIITVFSVIFFMNINSHAALVTYEVSGLGYHMFEHDGQTGINTTVTSSSLFGFNIRNDTIFNILFTYDTSAIESNFRQNYPDQNTAVYSSGLISYLAKVGNVNYSFNSPRFVQIWDNRPSGSSYTDAFSVSNSKFFDSDLFIMSSFDMFDWTGQSQTGFLIPENLDNIFNSSSNIFSFAWLDRNNGNQLHFNGNAISLKAVAVSEPAALTLLSLGFLSLGLFRKYKNTWRFLK